MNTTSVLFVVIVLGIYAAALSSGQPVNSFSFRECYYDQGNFADCKVQLIRRREALNESRFSPEIYQEIRDLWHKYMGEDENLLWHCLAYHQTLPLDKCNGITFGTQLWEINNGTVPTDRERWLTILWDHSQALISSWIESLKAKGEVAEADAARCLYQVRLWKSDPQDICQMVTSQGDEHFRQNETVFLNVVAIRLTYFSQRKRNNIFDCVRYHEFHKLDRCIQVTWDKQNEDRKPYTSPVSWVAKIITDNYQSNIVNIRLCSGNSTCLEPFKSRIPKDNFVFNPGSH